MKKSGNAVVVLAAILVCSLTAAEGWVTAVPTPSAVAHVVTSFRGGARIGFQRPSVARWKAAAALDGGGHNTPTSAELEAAEVEANNLRLTCAKWVLASGILDVALQGEKILSGDSWAIGLNTLWQFSFAYNLWRVTNQYTKLLQRQETDKAEIGRGIETVLRTMTSIWRQTAIVVTLLVLEEATKALQDKIPYVNQILWSLLGIGFVTTVLMSRKETASLALSEPMGDETPRDRVIRHGRVTLRAMSLCSAAFLMNALFLAFIAISQDSLSGFAVKLIDLPTPLGLGTLLWGTRLAFGKALQVMTHNSNKDWIMTPKTGMELQQATIKFWTKAKGTIKLQVILTAGAAIVSLVKGYMAT